MLANMKSGLWSEKARGGEDILFLNTYDASGGAAKACIRLVNELTRRNVPIAYLVREKLFADSCAVSVLSRITGRMSVFLDGLPQRLYPQRQRHNFSSAWFPTGVVKQCLSRQPQLLHLHWVVNGFLRIEDLTRITCPIVWSLHDSWVFTGGCHLPGDCLRYRYECGDCPSLGSRKTVDLSRKVWLRKRAVFDNLPLTVVTPSHWLARQARASSLLQNRPVEVIPNGLDTRRYSPGDKTAARALLGLHQERKIILFGAWNALSDHNKGADLLWDALRRLPAATLRSSAVVVFGDPSGQRSVPVDLPVLNLGRITNEEEIISLYRAADMCVLPSRTENLPNVIAEAMACGIPCAAFGVGGIPEMIVHKRTGSMVPAYDTAALAEEISWILGDENRRQDLSSAARDHAVRQFDIGAVADQYMALYERILAKGMSRIFVMSDSVRRI